MAHYISVRHVVKLIKSRVQYYGNILIVMRINYTSKSQKSVTSKIQNSQTVEEIQLSYNPKYGKEYSKVMEGLLERSYSHLQRGYTTNKSKVQEKDSVQIGQFRSKHPTSFYKQNQQTPKSDFNKEPEDRKNNKTYNSQASNQKKSSVVVNCQQLQSCLSQENMDEIDEKNNLLSEIKDRKPYELNWKAQIIEIIVAYALTFGITYLLKACSLPYYEIILIFSFLITVQPWVSSSFLALIAVPIVLSNNFLSLQLLNYPSIAVCYLSVLMYNQRHKIKILYLVILVCLFLFCFMAVPALYQVLLPSRIVFYYIFPLLMLLVKLLLYATYYIINKSCATFLQLPLLLMGLEYGVILTLSASSIQFWYLMVFYTLQIMIERTQLPLRILKSVFSANKDPKQPKSHLLIQSNGFSCLHSFHLVCIIYIFGELALYAPPYTPTLSIKTLYDTEWYKPLIVWVLRQIYEVMSIRLERKRKDILLFGWPNNIFYWAIIRGIIFSLGIWMFYLGLGIGVYLLIL